MSQWKKIASFAALFASMALTTTGCVETADADDQTTDDTDVAAPEKSPVMLASPERGDKPADKADEKTGQAEQRCCDADEDFAIRLFIHPFFTCFGGIGPCGCGGFGGFGGGCGGFGGGCGGC